MNTYQSLNSFLGSRTERRVAGIRSTTIIRRSPTAIAVKYHATDVVLAHADGTFTLKTNGYHTSTTKARINNFSPARVYQKSFEWFHVNGAAFEDGQHVDAAGTVLDF